MYWHLTKTGETRDKFSLISISEPILFKLDIYRDREYMYIILDNFYPVILIIVVEQWL